MGAPCFYFDIAFEHLESIEDLYNLNVIDDVNAGHLFLEMCQSLNHYKTKKYIRTDHQRRQV